MQQVVACSANTVSFPGRWCWRGRAAGKASPGAAQPVPGQPALWARARV